MKFVKSGKSDKEFINENMMGPNCVKLLEDLMRHVRVEPGMRVLDLGCGRALTSIYLAKAYDATVYATDLWITSTENYNRVVECGVDNLVIPIHADAAVLPYADAYFDAVISVDAYHYFGTDASFMDTHIAPLVKSGGTIAICVPGTDADYHETPEALRTFLSDEDMKTLRSLKWWHDLLKKSELFKLEEIWEPACFDEVWKDWLSCDNEYAVQDREMMRAAGGKYLNFVSIVGKRV